MKKEQLEKLKEKTKEDLAKELETSKDNLWQLKLDLAAGKVKNIQEIRKMKKTVAVINTILKEKK